MTTLSGCACLDACARTLDLSPFAPMCVTFYGAAAPANGTAGCAAGRFGQFDPLRAAFWEQCTAAASNATAADGAGSSPLSVSLTSFSAMFSVMFFSSVGGVVAAHLLVAAALLWTLAHREFRLMASVPSVLLAMAVAGVLHAALPAAVFAAFVALVYLSIPYAITSGVAIVLGLTLAGVLLFFAFNRDQPRKKPPHATEFNEL